MEKSLNNEITALTKRTLWRSALKRGEILECAQCKRKSCGIHCDIWIKSMNSEGKGRSVGWSDKLKSMNSEGKGRSVGRSDKLKSMNSEGKGRSVGRLDKLKSMNSEGNGRSDKLKSMNSEGNGRSDKLKSMNSEGNGRSDKLKSMNSEGKGQSVGRSVSRLLGLPELMKYRLLGPKCRVYTLRKGFIT